MESEYAALDVGDLVRRAQAKDIRSYEEIVRRFRALVFGQAFGRLGDSQLAEDAVQDSFIEAHLKLESLAVPEAFPGWFRKVVVTACNRITRRRSVTTVPLDEAESVVADCVNSSSRLEQLERDQVVHALIHDVLGLYSVRAELSTWAIGRVSSNQPSMRVDDHLSRIVQ